MLFLGIDPGLSGALILFQSLPPHQILREIRIDLRRVRARDLVPALQETLADFPWSDRGQILPVLEDATAFPGQSLSSSSRFAIVRGALQSLFHPVECVSPRVWKRKFALTPDKRLSIAMAEPFFNRKLKLKEHDMAEAFLIAYSTLFPTSRPSPFA